MTDFTRAKDFEIFWYPNYGGRKEMDETRIMVTLDQTDYMLRIDRNGMIFHIARPGHWSGGPTQAVTSWKLDKLQTLADWSLEKSGE